MRIPLHTRLICCTLALLVLLSSVGIGTVEHWCQMRGHSKTLLVAQGGCAKPCQSDDSPVPPADGQHVKRMPCCKTTVSYTHLDVSRTTVVDNAVHLPGFLPDWFAAGSFPKVLSPFQPVSAIRPTPACADDPPAKSGRFRLTSLCSWLI